MNFAKIIEDNKYKKTLFTSLKEKCGLNHIQYYSPYFNTISNNITENSILKTNEYVSSINTNINFFDPENDIKKTVNKLFNIDEFEDINNIYDLEVNINTSTSTTESITTTKKIICKVSPIINPIFLFDDDIDINNIYFTNNVPEQFKKEIEATNNFAYVESFILYNVSNLTLNNLTPLFPMYHGSVNGIAKHYYFNITEYLDDIYGTRQFDKIKKIYNILYFNDDDVNDTDSSSSDDLDTVDFNNSPRLSPNISDNSDTDDNDDNNNANNISNDDCNTKSNFFSMIEDRLNSLDINEDNKKIQKIKSALSMDNLFDDLNFVSGDTSDNSQDDEEIIPIELRKQIFPELDLDNIPEEDKFTADNKYMYICLENYPVNYCFMEKLSKTLEDYLEEEIGHLKNEEWYAIFFQLAYGLAVANKLLDFVHNDLHECNVMFQETEEEFIYYTIHNNTYRIPTYGKIVKIIDFARSTIKFADKWIISNHYEEDHEAYGIYDLPNNKGKYESNDNKPNPSFDLIRFFTTIAPYLEDNNDEVYDFIYKWSYDDDKERNMIDEDNEFELYITIAHTCHNCVPSEFLKDIKFTELFGFNDNIPKTNTTMVYNFADTNTSTNTNNCE